MGFIRGWFISGSKLSSQPQAVCSFFRNFNNFALQSSRLQIPTSSPDLTKKKKLIPEQSPIKKQVDFSSKDLISLAAIPVLYPRKEAIIRLFDSHHKYCLLRPIPIGNKSRILQTRPMSGGNTISILQTSTITSAVKAKPPHCSDVTTLAQIQEEYHEFLPPEIQENFGIFWKLYCYPWNREIWNKKQPTLQHDLFLELEPLLESAIPEYPDVIKELVSGFAAPEEGKYFDVVSFLSSCGSRVLIRNNGDQVSLSTDHFRGKYLLICCFLVPGYHSFHVQALIDFCNELYSIRDDFEVVMVARMNSLANDKAVFDSFFSGFPESCLAVPFEDSKQRDYICSLVGMASRGYKFLFLDNKGIVLPFLPWSCFEFYGAEAFPFTYDIRHKIEEKRNEMHALKSSLEEMLQSNESSSSPAIVYKLNPAGGPREEIPISDLHNKHVALYLCLQGNLIPGLLSVYEQCMKKKLDFEIVVVNVPDSSVEPRLYQKRMERLLQKHGIYDWWCLPFNNSVSRRLYSLIAKNRSIEDYNMDNDKLTVVGPLVKGVMQSYCDEVLENHGVDAYPFFTIDAGIQVVMNKVRRFTLQSLIAGKIFRGNNRNDVLSVEDLRGRKILLHVGPLRKRIGYAVAFYHEMKAKNSPGFEIVYVEVDEEDAGSQILSKIPWYVCPSDGANFTSLEALLGLVYLSREGVIGFDEDGQICLISEVGDYQTYFLNCLLDSDRVLYGCVESRFGYYFPY